MSVLALQPEHSTLIGPISPLATWRERVTTDSRLRGAAPARFGRVEGREFRDVAWLLDVLVRARDVPPRPAAEAGRLADLARATSGSLVRRAAGSAAADASSGEENRAWRPLTAGSPGCWGFSSTRSAGAQNNARFPSGSGEEAKVRPR